MGGSFAIDSVLRVEQGGRYENALYAASSEGHEQINRLLVENVADVDAKDNNGFTPLILVAY